MKDYTKEVKNNKRLGSMMAGLVSLWDDDLCFRCLNVTKSVSLKRSSFSQDFVAVLNDLET